MLKIQLQQALMTELNTNTQGVKFVLGKLGQTKNSKFTIETYGTSVGNELGPMFYELVTEEFVPVVVNNFDAVYSFDNQFNRRSYVAKFSFLIDEQKQDPALEAIDAFIEGLVGNVTKLNNFSLFFQPQDLKFVETLVLNDIKFLEFEMNLTIRLAETSEFGSSLNLSLKLPQQLTYTNLNLISYTPVRVNQTVPVQYVGSNSTRSISQASSWSATVSFYIRTDTDSSTVLNSLITQLENSSQEMNTLYNLRVYNPITEITYDKTVIVSSITMPVQIEGIMTMNIVLEEANEQVLVEVV